LRAEGHVDDVYFTDLDAEAEVLAARIRAGCRAMSDPDPVRMFDHVYHEPHSGLAAERAAFEAYEATFGPVEEVSR